MDHQRGHTGICTASDTSVHNIIMVKKIAENIVVKTLWSMIMFTGSRLVWRHLPRLVKRAYNMQPQGTGMNLVHMPSLLCHIMNMTYRMHTKILH